MYGSGSGGLLKVTWSDHSKACSRQCPNKFWTSSETEILHLLCTPIPVFYYPHSDFVFLIYNQNVLSCFHLVLLILSSWTALWNHRISQTGWHTQGSLSPTPGSMQYHQTLCLKTFFKCFLNSGSLGLPVPVPGHSLVKNLFLILNLILFWCSFLIKLLQLVSSYYFFKCCGPVEANWL